MCRPSLLNAKDLAHAFAVLGCAGQCPSETQHDPLSPRLCGTTMGQRLSIEWLQAGKGNVLSRHLGCEAISGAIFKIPVSVEKRHGEAVCATKSTQ